ncbi:protein angel homolog 1 isoform X2 [Esox lucius]|uniref:Endonuclease/exonuclease/phosphatase domain-containing protein n=1 Tax=Esox lucius TaxID=8010 RepID=A0A3P8ZNC0_ESOLU|nr:protein angel homolog 1 isoform X2 [Esox lucius]
MIGSLMFYGLYPLTRFLNRVSESLKRQPSFVSINGKEVWDGGVSCRRFTKTQTALLEQWLSTGNGPPNTKKPEREAGEGLKENATLGKETRKEVVMKKNTIKEEGPEKAREEPVFMALGQEAEAEMSEGNKAEDRDVMKEERVSDEAPLPQDQKPPSPHSEELRRYVDLQETPCNPTEESEDVKPTPLLTSEAFEVQNPSVDSGSEDISSDDSPMVRVMLRQEEEMMNMKDSLTKAQVPKQDRDSQVERDNAAGLCLASAGVEPAEIWDTGMDLVSLLSQAQTEPWETWPQAQSKGWHFPVGPGLEEVLFCPSTSSPGISYYPQLSLEKGAFEVVWRLWEDLSETHTPEKAPSESQALFDFTVMSYNILAQDLLEANQELYTHCPLEVLSWDHRFPNLIKEFKKWEPDILCLQEVQENHFTEQLCPALRDMGYSCVYKRRTGTKTDGCAVCYLGHRFAPVSESLLEFYRPDCEVLDRDNVGIVLLLQPVITPGSQVTAVSPPLCVATTHLLFNPRRGDVKLAQLALLLAEIDCTVRNTKVKGDPCNVVLCGDFNAVPNMPLYQLITTRQLYYHGLPTWMISGQEDLSYQFHQRRVFAPLLPNTVGIDDHCRYTTVIESASQEVASTRSPKPGNLRYERDFLRGLRFCEAACVKPLDMPLIPGVTDITPNPNEQHPRKSFRQTLSHQVNLQSAYDHFSLGTDQAEVTTLHSQVGATVDYIFYSPKMSCSGGGQKGGHRGLKLLGRLSLLSEKDLWSMKGLPSAIFPSDHLSLLARFQMG